MYLVIATSLVSGEISQGKDQRDHFYFIAMGHYKLEVHCTYHELRGVARILEMGGQE